MRSKLLILWVLPFLVFAADALGQHPYFLQLNRQKGLTSDEVYNVYQDTKGYIWLATTDGLSRYDGFEFVPYKSDLQTSLAGSCIQEDRLGRIWYENFDGYLYYTEGGKLKSIDQKVHYYYVPFGLTTHYVFVTTRLGVNVYDLRTLRIVKSIGISSDKTVHAVGAGNCYYVLANSRLYRIDDQLQVKWVPVAHQEADIAYNIFAAGDRVYVSYTTDTGKVLCGYDRELRAGKVVGIPQPEIIQSGSYVDGQMYINTPSGSYMYDLLGGNGRVEPQIYFEGKSISTVLRDRQNNYWFSTTNEGIYIVPDLNNRMYTMPGHVPAKIAVAPDGFYIGTQAGSLLHVDKKFDRIEQISASKGGSNIFSLYADKQQIIYSATGFTIHPLSGAAEEFYSTLPLKQVVKLDDKYYAFASSVFCGLLQNPSGPSSLHSIWDDAFEKDKQSGIKGVSHLIEVVRGKSVTYDTVSHSILFATNRGVYVVSPNSVKELTNNGQPVYAKSLHAVNGNLYALTSMGALIKMPYDDKLRQGDSVSNVVASGVSFMKRFDDELYLYCNGTIHVLHMPSGALHKLDISVEIHGINDILKQDGELFLVTSEGIIALNSYKKADKKPALFYINSITANGTVISASQMNSLKYNENNIAVHFSVLDFGRTDPAAVYYQLNNNDWVEIAKDSRLLQFPSLSPGAYILSFRLGTNQNSVTNVAFSVLPAFWMQWWFYLICLLLVVVLVLIYYKHQMRSRIKKLEVQREKMLLEQDLGKSMLTSIRAQMNPHFFYNALNTIQAYIFMNDKVKANNYLAKFSRLTRTILEMSEAEHVLLSDEAETMKLYLELEKMRFDGSFEYDMRFEGIENKEMIEIPSMIIQPYVENAIKHGLLHKAGEKILLVVFALKGNVLLVTIDDNGIGRKRSEELNKIKEGKSRSFSTKASEKRMELLNKGRSEKISVNITDKLNPNGSAAGTLVVLRLPI